MRSNAWLRRASWLGCLWLAAAALPAVRAAEPHAEDEEIELVVTQSAARKYTLGTKLTSVPEVLDDHLKLHGKGALVAEVTADGPAAKAGVKVHDILVSVNDSEVTDLAQVVDKLDASEGKAVVLKLLRAGETVQLEVQPDVLTPAEDKPAITIDIPSLGVGKIAIDGAELEGLERELREKLKRAGVDFRMQFIRPGHLLPKAVADLDIVEKLPDDLDIRIHKHGNEPAEIEVRQGEQSWSIKENELPELPEKVRQHVEAFLGRTPGKVTLALPGGQEFRVAMPPPIAVPKPAGPVEIPPDFHERYKKAREKVEEHAKAAHEEAQKRIAEAQKRVEEARQKGEEASRLVRERFEQARVEATRRQEEVQRQVERRLEQMSCEMEQMRKQLEELHKRLIADEKPAEPQQTEVDDKD